MVGQREEDVLLPAVSDEEAAQRRVPQHTVRVLHSQRAPVEAAALKLDRGVCDDPAVLLAGKGWEVGEIHGGHACYAWVPVRSRPVLKLLRLCAEGGRRGRG